MSMPLLSLRQPRPLPTLHYPKPQPVASDAPVKRQISSQLLLDGARELVIQHQGSEYYLRLTRNDKLILTK